MARNEERRSALRAALPLAIVCLAACAAPESGESVADAAPAATAEVPALAAAPASDIRTMIAAEAVHKGGVPPALALAVAKVGSNLAASALDATGAVGTMQIPPALADEFDLDADDLHAAAANIRAGIACLAALQERYGGDWRLALSHYRGGRYRSRTVPSRHMRSPAATCATYCGGGGSTDTILSPPRGCGRCKDCRVSPPLAPAAEG